MKKDITIPISAVMLVGGYVAAGFLGISEEITADSPLSHKVVFACVFLAALRAMILWFQTLIDAVRPKDQKGARVGWVLLHFVIGPFASYPYYFVHGGDTTRRSLADSEADIRRRANEGRL